MCLELSSYSSRSRHGKVRKDRNIPRNIPRAIMKLSSDTRVAFWKVYRRRPSGKLRSPYVMLSPVTHGGYQISDRSTLYPNDLTKKELNNRVVYNGIHVFVDRLAARREMSFIRRSMVFNRSSRYLYSILKVWAKREDIVAYDVNGVQAVCSKIYVPSADKTKKMGLGPRKGQAP